MLSPNLKGRYPDYEFFNSEVYVLTSSYTYGSMYEARWTVCSSSVEKEGSLYLQSLFWC